MAERVQKVRERPAQEEEVAGDDAAATKQEQHDKMLADIDAVLDDIDEVLEEEAQSFVRDFVQKGGQ